MKQTDIIDRIADAAGMTKANAKTALDTVWSSIIDAAHSGEDLSIPGFGKFSVKEMPARKGRNPATGAEIDIAASRKLSFTPAKAVKDSLAASASTSTKT